MNSLWDIRIFLGLVPKESHCTFLANWSSFHWKFPLHPHSHSRPSHHLPLLQALWQVWSISFVLTPSQPRNDFLHPVLKNHRLWVTHASFHVVTHHAHTSVKAWVLKNYGLSVLGLRIFVYALCHTSIRHAPLSCTYAFSLSLKKKSHNNKGRE